MNTLETYYGGPLRSDLMVDGIVYDYIGKSPGLKFGYLGSHMLTFPGSV